VLALGTIRLLLAGGFTVREDVARLWLTVAAAERWRLAPYALAVVLTFLSYPRISDFKLTFLVVAAGCVAALDGLLGQPAFAGLEAWILGPVQTEPALVFALLNAANLAVATLMPAAQRSRLTWELSLAVATGEVAACAAVSRLVTPWLASHPWLVLGHVVPPFTWVIALAAAAGLLSWRLASRSFGLGGGIAGLAVILPAAHGLRGSPLDPACSMAPGIFLLLTVLYVWSVRLRFRISYDPLMQIYNRAHGDELLAQGAGGRELAIAMIDVDHFKELNDRHGHAAGDEVLHAVAQAVRREGLPHGVCCRYGGEEIIVFLEGQPPAAAGQVFEKMRRAVARLALDRAGRPLRTSVSIGWAHAPAGSNVPSPELVDRADRALYRAKAEGRDRVVQG
jgi:diguanylate cyclase (GGDEF)-like protein